MKPSRWWSSREVAFDLEPDRFFVLRTPLLPWEAIEALSAGLRAPGIGEASDEELDETLSYDRELVRERLASLVALPEIREALFVASPSLVSSGLVAWRHEPDSKKGRRAEQSLVRYIYRMTTRATPFGLFSGCSMGEIGEQTRLRLMSRKEYRRHTRPDMDHLAKLSRELAADPKLCRELAYLPNSSLYRAGGRLRYVVSRYTGHSRSYHLVAVDEDDFLSKALQTSESGACFGEIVEAVLRADRNHDVSVEEAEKFVAELIDEQLLVADLVPLTTGDAPLDVLISQLERLNSAPLAASTAEILTEERNLLSDVDDSGLGVKPEVYRRIADRVQELPTQPELSRIVQVDLVKPGDNATLGQDVLDELLHGLETLYRLSSAKAEDPMDSFRKKFLKRYQSGQLLPLTEVLDEEIGIGFANSVGPGGDNSPLLDGLDLASPDYDRTMLWTAKEDFLLQKLSKAVYEGDREIKITDKDMAGFPLEGLPPLPDAMAATAIVAARSTEALEDGRFQVYIRGGHGPSGARLMGRFCHADPILHENVRAHLQLEEAKEPNCVYAEIVHLPEDRLGNVLCRPVLRDYEIQYLGASGAPEACQLSIHDLLVTVRGRRVLLFSKRLGKEVIPRLTSAHNYSTRGLGVYRFLCNLQGQGLAAGLTWSWGPLQAWPFLPRVRKERCVLARASWNLRRDELEPFLRSTGVDRCRSVRKWRRMRNLPRMVVYIEGDNELVVDLENELSLDAFLAVVERQSHVALCELFPAPDALVAKGPEGHFYHELLVPFVRKREPTQEESSRSPVVTTCRRTFPPGSEWLYARLFTGTASADQLLLRIVSPLCREVMSSGALDRWFFIRYADPHWHLRLRFHGDPARLKAEVVPLLESAVGTYLARGLLWRVQLDTYEREVERYGGDSGIELAEQVFHVDSEAVLTIVENLEGDEGASIRWRLALKGVNQIFDDFDFDLEHKLALLTRLQSSYAEEFQVQLTLKKHIANRLRDFRVELEDLLYGTPGRNHPMAPGLAALAQRSVRMRPLVRNLRELDELGSLTASLDELAASFAHMFTNRLLRSDGRAHELILYDLLTQLTRSRMARERSEFEIKS